MGVKSLLFCSRGTGPPDSDSPLYLPYKTLVSTVGSMVFNEGEAQRLIEILSEKAGIIQDTWHKVGPLPWSCCEAPAAGQGSLALPSSASLALEPQLPSGGCLLGWPYPPARLWRECSRNSLHFFWAGS